VVLTVLYALQMMVIITSTKEAVFSPWKLKLESNLYTPVKCKDTEVLDLLSRQVCAFVSRIMQIGLHWFS